MVLTSPISSNTGQTALQSLSPALQADVSATESRPVTNANTLSQALSRASLCATNPCIRDLIDLIHDLISGDTITLLQSRAKEYIDSFQYLPINKVEDSGVTYKDPVKYSLDDLTLQKITDLVLDTCMDSKITAQVLERVLFKPAVLAKLALIYEHPGMMTGANTEGEKLKLVRKLIRQFSNDDSALRYIKEELPDLYKTAIDNPELYARVTIAHRWACKKCKVDPNDTDKQRALTGGSKLIAEEILKQITGSEEKRRLQQMTMIANLQLGAPIPRDPSNSNITIGESVFFKPLIDNNTLSLTQFVLDAFERGIRNVEVAADFLPFDSSKRLPSEYTDEEIARVRELVKCLGMSFTVHSPIVGPLHPKTKFTALLEDAADNVSIMKDTIDFAGKLGAKTIVVHISDRDSEETINRYAEIASYAVGKYSADGKPLRVVFENYMNKALPGGNKPFPTMEEHFAPFGRIVKKVVNDAMVSGKDPVQALQHVALLLDSAHFNLVPNMEDPLRAVQVLPKLSKNLAIELLSDPQIGPRLIESGFNIREFAQGIVAELHLNQNIGPITFTVPGKDYNADIHAPVESIGTIDNVGFVSLVYDLGFTPVILAEQKNELSPGGLQILYNAAKDCPGTVIPRGPERVNCFIENGTTVISDYKKNHPEEYLKIKALLEGDDGIPHPYYKYIVGRFGMNHLIEHLNRRALHFILSPQTGHLTSELLETLNAKSRAYKSGDLIIKQDTTYEQAQKEDTNCFYLIAKGHVEVEIPGRDNTKLGPGMPFGEAMFLSGKPRSANVKAGSEGAVVIEIPEDVFLKIYELLQAFQSRLNEHFDRRFNSQEVK